MKFPAVEVSDYVKKRVNRMRGLYPHLDIGHADWADITQDIVIHVCSKWSHHYGDKWRHYVGTIVRNQVINQLRNRMTRARRMPLRPLRSRLIQHADSGREEVIYEHDMAPYEDGIFKTRAALAQLTGQHKVLVDEFLRCGSWGMVEQKLKTNQHHAMKIRCEMAAYVRAAIDADHWCEIS